MEQVLARRDENRIARVRAKPRAVRRGRRQRGRLAAIRGGVARGGGGARPGCRDRDALRAGGHFRIAGGGRRGRCPPGGAGETADLGAADLRPRFLSESYWLDFAFEPGNYYFAGRERLAGAGRARRAPHRVLPGAVVPGTRPRRRRLQSAADQRAGRPGGVQREHPRHPLGRPRRASDRAVHVRRHRLRLPAPALRSFAWTSSARR